MSRNRFGMAAALVRRIGITAIWVCGAAAVTATGAEAQPLSPVFSLTQANAGLDAEAVAVGDVNKDGKPDVIVANYGGHRASVLLGDGAGSFVPNTTIELGVLSSPVGLAIGDFDRDGAADLAILVWQTASSGSVRIYRGNGSGGFAFDNESVVGHPTSIMVADVDRDGYSDIVLSLHQENKLSIQYGSGSFVHGTPVEIGGGPNPYAAAVADLNGDGRLDLIVSNYVIGASTISVVMATGNRTFAPPVGYPSGPGSAGVIAADFNGDGKIDVAVSNTTSGEVAVLRGTGSGTLQAAEFTALGGGGGVAPLAFSLAAPDLNRDGLLDIVAANSGTNVVTLALGRATGGFSKAEPLLSNTRVRRMVAADVNGDLRMDLIVTGDTSASNTLSVLVNASEVGAVVTTGVASGIGATTATLNGTANPSGTAATGHFEYGLTTAYGATTPVQTLGSGNIAIAIGGGSLSGLSCNTAYHFRATATNAGGTSSGSDATFTTSACSGPVPTVSTGSATSITPASATLNGSVNPNGIPTTAYFQYGTTTGYGSTTIVSIVGSGMSNVPLSQTISGLNCNTPYHFRLIAQSGAGSASGNDAIFTTTACFLPLAITTQPESQHIKWRRTATLSVAATGTLPLTYQWYAGTSGSTTSPIAGATSSSYTTLALTSTTTYWVRVTDATGTADSATATVAVAFPNLLDLNSDRGGDVFLYNKATGARRFELINPLTPGFIEIPSAWDSGWQVYPANLNADESTDMFLYDPVRGFWIQALNNAGDGTFTYTLGNWDSSWTVVPADLDGDGLTDMFVYNFATGVWVKCFADGSGGFKGYAAGNWDPGWTFTRADLNGDGRDDFFLYNRVNGVWVEAMSRAGFDSFDYPASGMWDPGWQVTPADLNGDGRADLSLLNAAGVHVSALSLATGGFVYAAAQWATGWSVFAGDLDRDGTQDLFLYNAASGAWLEAFSDGAGSFTFASGTWDPGWSVAVTDFNQDGRGDIILTRADGTWVQATNSGGGTFTYAAGNWGTGWTVYTSTP